MSAITSTRYNYQNGISQRIKTMYIDQNNLVSNDGKPNLIPTVYAVISQKGEINGPVML